MKCTFLGVRNDAASVKFARSAKDALSCAKDWCVKTCDEKNVKQVVVLYESVNNSEVIKLQYRSTSVFCTAVRRYYLSLLLASPLFKTFYFFAKVHTRCCLRVKQLRCGVRIGKRQKRSWSELDDQIASIVHRNKCIHHRVTIFLISRILCRLLYVQSERWENCITFAQRLNL